MELNKINKNINKNQEVDKMKKIIIGPVIIALLSIFVLAEIDPGHVPSEIDWNIPISNASGSTTIKINSSREKFSAIDFYANGINMWGIGKDGNNNFYISEFGVSNRIYIERGSGNVGIGVDNPQYKLDVNGDIRASGTICDGDGECINDIIPTCDDGELLRFSEEAGEFECTEPITNRISRITNFEEIYNNAVFGTDYKTGASPISDYVDAIIEHNGELYLGAENYVLYKRNPSAPVTERWVPVKRYESWVSALASYDGYLWVATYYNGLYRIYKYRVESDGTLTEIKNWGAEINKRITSFAIFDGKLWAGSSNGYIYVLINEDGEERWLQFPRARNSHNVGGGVNLSTSDSFYSIESEIGSFYPTYMNIFGNTNPKLLIGTCISGYLAYIEKIGENRYALKFVRRRKVCCPWVYAEYDGDLFVNCKWVDDDVRYGALLRLESGKPAGEETWWNYGTFLQAYFLKNIDNKLFMGIKDYILRFSATNLSTSNARNLNNNTGPESGRYLNYKWKYSDMVYIGPNDKSDGLKYVEGYPFGFYSEGTQMFIGSKSRVALTDVSTGDVEHDQKPGASTSVKYERIRVPEYCIERMCKLRILIIGQDTSSPSGLQVKDVYLVDYSQLNRFDIYGNSTGGAYVSSYGSKNYIGHNGDNTREEVYYYNSYIMIRDDSTEGNVYIPGEGDNNNEVSPDYWIVYDNDNRYAIIVEAAPIGYY